MPVAIDVSIVSPFLFPSRCQQATVYKLEESATGKALDEAAMRKSCKYADACQKEGWVLKPFIVDTFGALRADAKTIVNQIIGQLEGKDYPATITATVAEDVWRGVSAAIISRATKQLVRATSFASVLPTNAACDMPTSVTTSHGPHLLDMGTSTMFQPSPTGTSAQAPHTTSADQPESRHRPPENAMNSGHDNPTTPPLTPTHASDMSTDRTPESNSSRPRGHLIPPGPSGSAADTADDVIM